MVLSRHYIVETRKKITGSTFPILCMYMPVLSPNKFDAKLPAQTGTVDSWPCTLLRLNKKNRDY